MKAATLAYISRRVSAISSAQEGVNTLLRLANVRAFNENRDRIYTELIMKVSKDAKIRNRYNQVPHLTQDTNGKVTNSQQTPQTRVKRSALSQQVTTKHI